MSKEYDSWYTCPNCFFQWIEFSKKKATTNEKLCTFCNENQPMSDIQRIDRYLSIMSGTAMHNMSVILPLIWKIVKTMKPGGNGEILTSDSSGKPKWGKLEDEE